MADHSQTREMIVSESTEHSNSARRLKQTEAFPDQTLNREDKPATVMYDCDTKFTKEFIAKLEQHVVRHISLLKVSPNLNGRRERFVGTSHWECPDKFNIFGKRLENYSDRMRSEYWSV